MAEHLYTYDDPPSERHLDMACRILEKDGVIAYQADMTWALGCDASNPRALERIRLLKPSHPKDQPFSLLCSSISMASEYGNIEHSAYRMLKRAWPGPFTVLLQRNRSLARQIKDKRRIVGIRIPQNRMLLALIERFSKPLASTTAPGVDGMTPIKFGYEVMDRLGHGIDLILDLGYEVSGAETSVVDLTEGYPQLIRRGEGDLKIFDL
jgi:tRNA threonylcarbamoyl adenosine modification protein (Sua5/YciO/YrdC/YwlC family)